MLNQKLLSLYLMLPLLALSACTPQTTPTARPVASSAATAAPTVVPPTTIAEPRKLIVFAATSLTESFTELGAMFESQHPGVMVLNNFSNPQQLVEQLKQGADVDVFASANKQYMDEAIISQLVVPTDAKTFATNRLIVIYPKSNPAGLIELKDLANSGVILDLADSGVPVGKYSIEFLDKASKDEKFGATFKEEVLRNVVSYENTVKAVVAKVVLGEADAGIVYATDFTNAVADKAEKMDIPDAINSIATYPIARVANSKNPDLAKAFVDLVLSPEGQAVLKKYGFLSAN